MRALGLIRRIQFLCTRAGLRLPIVFAEAYTPDVWRETDPGTTAHPTGGTRDGLARCYRIADTCNREEGKYHVCTERPAQHPDVRAGDQSLGGAGGALRFCRQ